MVYRPKVKLRKRGRDRESAALRKAQDSFGTKKQYISVYANISCGINIHQDITDMSKSFRRVY